MTELNRYKMLVNNKNSADGRRGSGRIVAGAATKDLTLLVVLAGLLITTGEAERMGTLMKHAVNSAMWAIVYEVGENSFANQIVRPPSPCRREFRVPTLVLPSIHIIILESRAI